MSVKRTLTLLVTLLCLQLFALAEDTWHCPDAEFRLTVVPKTDFRSGSKLSGSASRIWKVDISDFIFPDSLRNGVRVVTINGKVLPCSFVCGKQINLEDIKQKFRDVPVKDVFGEGPVDVIQQTRNIFHKWGNFCSYYSGMLNAPRSGTYRFSIDVIHCGFLAIDGKEVVGKSLELPSF